MITEILLTFIFLLVILGATDDRAPKGFAGLAIGLTLSVLWGHALTALAGLPSWLRPFRHVTTPDFFDMR